MSEEVLLHDEKNNITITHRRIIVGDAVTPIEDVESSVMCRAIFPYGCRDRLIGIGCIFFAIICFANFSMWTAIIGLVLLAAKPLPIFFKYMELKDKFMWLVKLKSGDLLNDHDSNGHRRLYTRLEAAGLDINTNIARYSYEEEYNKENDPRKGLDLG
jgi:hypothetical protein